MWQFCSASASASCCVDHDHGNRFICMVHHIWGFGHEIPIHKMGIGEMAWEITQIMWWGGLALVLCLRCSVLTFAVVYVLVVVFRFQESSSSCCRILFMWTPGFDVRGGGGL